MPDYFQIQLNYRNRERQIVNALLALTTGCLTLIYPNFLYLIAGGYLVALGLLFMGFRVSSTVSAIPIVTGIIIFIFPELIPVTFAAFLGLFGFILLFGFQFSIIGVITLIIALLIAINPGSIAYLIASFLLVYSVSNGTRFYQQWQNKNNRSGNDISVD